VGGRLFFASELRDLLELLPSAPGPDRDGVAHWISLSTRPGTGTLYEGVEKLGPGEMLRFGPGGISRSRYWEPRFQEPLELSPGEWAERVREGLRVAVERRLDPDGGTGVLLSGGLDSASVAAVGAASLSTCSGTFPEHPQADEAELIAGLRRALGLGGLVAEVRPGGLLASVFEYTAAWRAPLLGWGDFWTLPLMRAAAERGVGTMLGGDGGDEVFAPRAYALADALRSGRPRRVLELARRLPGSGPHVGRRREAAMIARLALAGAMPPRPAGRALTWGDDAAPGYLTRSTRRRLRRSDDPDGWKRLDGPRWWAFAAHGVSRGIESTGVFEHQRRRAAMAGLEARHPMLDLDLVELALRQPPEQTLDPRFSRPVLREAMTGLVPDGVRLRPQKALFESLVVAAMRGPDGAAIGEILTAPGAEIGAYVDRERMTASLFGSGAVRKEGEFRWMWQVWRLLTAEVWLRSLSSGNGFPEPESGLSKARVEIRSA
ncbi:MAG TPA: asparagine synthase-related protein, partial [Solirubrobacterales bacterium]|nr:asparagine synthase-related protein [Solirubrobacterales bacterium]